MIIYLFILFICLTANGCGYEHEVILNRLPLVGSLAK
jgi:hypothetical protein